MAEDEGRDATYQLYPPRPKWTVMIYLAGDNNLSANSIAIMQELEAANISPSIRVLACFDSNTPRPRGARYLEIQHRRHKVYTGIDWGLHNDLVPPEERGHLAVTSPDFCNLNPASVHLPREPTARVGLSRFLAWALRYHRAERYMLILFGHGTAVAGNTFLTDSNPPSFLRLSDFADVLRKYFGEGRPRLNILACHNCIMNGIESAYEIRRQVDFMLGSQGLVLAAGWPYRRIINAIARNPSAGSRAVALKVLRACARGLLDFSLMDRSSEQSVCDLRELREYREHGEPRPLLAAVKQLVGAMTEGLATDRHTGEVRYPIIRDAVKLARLEAQSYWGETFVDLYDFCELLKDKCNEFLPQIWDIVESTPKDVLDDKYERLSTSDSTPKEGLAAEAERVDLEKFVDTFYQQVPFGKALRRIIYACKAVLDEFKHRRVVPYSYYVGSQLQYSHGLSVYFPWSLPEDPLIFEPSFYQPDDFLLKTAFEEYKSYAFAKVTGWDCLLEQFFRATLRDVRRVEYRDRTDEERVRDEKREKFMAVVREAIGERDAPPVDLQKSGSDVDTEEDCVCPTIKNYPRRFYLSPADCRRLSGLTAGAGRSAAAAEKNHVSYLGWNIRGIVAEEIGLPPEEGSPGSAAALSDGAETEPEGEPERPGGDDSSAGGPDS